MGFAHNDSESSEHSESEESEPSEVSESSSINSEEWNELVNDPELNSEELWSESENEISSEEESQMHSLRRGKCDIKTTDFKG